MGRAIYIGHQRGGDGVDRTGNPLLRRDDLPDGAEPLAKKLGLFWLCRAPERRAVVRERSRCGLHSGNSTKHIDDGSNTVIRSMALLAGRDADTTQSRTAITRRSKYRYAGSLQLLFQSIYFTSNTVSIHPYSYPGACGLRYGHDKHRRNADADTKARAKNRRCL